MKDVYLLFHWSNIGSCKMDIVAGLTATTNAITIVKAMRSAETAYDTATLKAKLADVLVELADSRIAQTELVDEVRRLTIENARLVKADDDLEKLVEDAGYFYATIEKGSPIGWPACPSCISSEKSISFLVQDGTVLQAKCPKCKEKFAPVTSYLSSGYTRQQQLNDNRKRAQERQNAQFKRISSRTWRP